MIPTACSAGNYAIAYAYDSLRAGRADVVLAGGFRLADLRPDRVSLLSLVNIAHRDGNLKADSTTR